MATTTGVIEKVTFNESTGWYRTKLEGEDITFDTKYKEKAEAARDLVGQKAELEYDEKQNGEYTNRYLKKALPAAQSKPDFDPDPASVQKPMDPNTALRVTRLSAISSACTLLQGADNVGADDVINVAEYFVRYALDGPAVQLGGDDIPF